MASVVIVDKTIMSLKHSNILRVSERLHRQEFCTITHSLTFTTYFFLRMNGLPREEDAFGWAGGLLALIYNIPQIYVIFKTKKVDDLSVHSWVLRLVSYTFYIIHVYIKEDAALFYTYLVGFIQCLIITAQIFVYKSDCQVTNGVSSEQPKRQRAPDAETSSSDDDSV